MFCTKLLKQIRRSLEKNLCVVLKSHNFHVVRAPFIFSLEK